MTHEEVAVMQFPFGNVKLAIRLTGNTLTKLGFVPVTTRNRKLASAAGRRIIRQLKHYFSDPGSTFSIPLAPQGTDFQRKVWKALRDIPAGRVCSYGELADRLATSPRAVGNACRNNPIAIVIPCHRVVAASGPGGYSGDTDGDMLAVKERLLAHEHRG